MESLTSVRVKLTWSTVSVGSSGYYLYRATDPNGPYVRVGTAAGRYSLYYYDAGRTPGGNYYYNIAAYVTVSGVSYESAQSDYVSVRPLPGKPVITEVASAGATNLRVKWNAIPDATGYTLWYAFNEDGPYTDIDIPSASTTSYLMTDLVQSGQTCYVKLQGYVTVGGAPEGGAFSDVKSGVPKPQPIYGLTATPGADGAMVLTWTPKQTVGNMAAGYYIYRCDTPDGTYEQVLDVTSGDSNTATDEGLDIGQYYYYRISAYATGVGGKPVEGPISSRVGNYIRPSVPTSFTAVGDTYNSALLTWAVVGGVTGYEVYYSLNGTSYALLKRIDDADTAEFPHAKLTPGRRYYYKMRAYFRSATNSYLYGAFTEVQTVTPVPLAPTDAVASVHATLGRPKITWTRATGAAGYIIYYCDTEVGNYLIGTTLTSNTNVGYVANLIPGRTYYFKVRSFVTYNNTRYYSAGYSNTVSTMVAYPSPTSVTTTAKSYNSIQVNWSGVTGAQGYYIYIRLDDGTLVQQVTVAYGDSRSKVITSDLLSGRYLNVTVAAYGYQEDGVTIITGCESTVARRLVRLPAPTGVKLVALSATSTRLTWSAVANAQGYRVMRRVGTTGTYEQVAILKESDTLEYIDNDIDTIADYGDTLYYYVAAWLNGGGTDLFGAPSSVLSISRVTGGPETLTATADNANTISLAWDAVDGATGYLVYRSTSSNSGYAAIANMTAGETTYTNTAVNTGTTYYYRIRSYVRIGTKSYQGLYSPVASVTPTLEMVANLAAVSAGKNKITVTWDKTYGAYGYYLYVYKGAYTATPTKQVISGGGTVSRSVANLVANTTYYFRIQVYRIVNGKYVLGPITDYSTSAKTDP